MQREHFEGEHPEDEKRLLVAVKDAISRARAERTPVIALRHGWQTLGHTTDGADDAGWQGLGVGSGYGNFIPSWHNWWTMS